MDTPKVFGQIEGGPDSYCLFVLEYNLGRKKENTGVLLPKEKRAGHTALQAALSHQRSPRSKSVAHNCAREFSVFTMALIVLELA